jgi:hypothetical protein
VYGDANSEKSEQTDRFRSTWAGGTRTAPGRVEPKRGSDCSPETCRSKVLRDKIFERVGKVTLWPFV